MLWVLWLLVLCCAAGEQDVEGQDTKTNTMDKGWRNETGINRMEKFFSFFNVIRFKNNQCTGTNGQCGTCYSRRECSDLNGIASGSCARNWGTCCIIQKSCASSSSLNCTYFINPGFPGVYSETGRCSITVSKCDSNICQLRVDLLDFTIAQPNADGDCVDDFLEITGGATRVPQICGDNTGQHVYVDFQADSAPIQVRIKVNSGLTITRKWNIRINQIECASPERAPAGALMYYRELSGTVKSFNYGRTVEAPGARQLSNLNYGVFVRMAPGYCSIEWKQDAGDPYSFTVSGDTDVISPELLGTPDAALSGPLCNNDFVVISNPNEVATDRFCGNGFQDNHNLFQAICVVCGKQLVVNRPVWRLPTEASV